MTYCPRCGVENHENINFCPSCGLDLAATNPIAAIRSEKPQRTDIDIIREALKDDYEIDEELGRGGMAVVFRARDKALDREVALKVLPFSLAHDEEFVERFQREARTAAGLEHPNIIPVYRVGHAGEVIYFAMKLLLGQSLADAIEKRGSLPPGEIRDLLKQCAGGLGYAHHRGIVHRDVKPDNIMFGDRGEPIILDFGIAKAATGTRLTGTGMAIGTPYYMSPEQARAQKVDGRSDLYSLGVVAYQCLVGSVPFDGEDSFSIGYKHIMEEVPTPEMSSAEERSLFAVIQRMMAKDPDGRFQTAEDLVAALEGKEVPTRVQAPSASFTEAPTGVAPAAAAPAGRRVATEAPTQDSRKALRGTRKVDMLTGLVSGGDMVTEDEVFLCYNRRDEDFALALAKILLEFGVPLWVDKLSIPGGADWDHEIEEALHRCKHLIVVLSPNAQKSREVRDEFKTALEEGKNVVPVLYQESRIHRSLRNIQQVDFINRHPDDERSLKQLVRALGLLRHLFPQASEE